MESRTFTVHPEFSFRIEQATAQGKASVLRVSMCRLRTAASVARCAGSLLCIAVRVAFGQWAEGR
jgi:hypothetical protein